MLVQTVRWRKVPPRTLRLIVTPSAQGASAGVFINEFVGPLPDITDKVFYAKRASRLGMRIHRIGPSQLTFLVRVGYSCSVPNIAPWVEPSIATLRCVLPFPFVRKALRRPDGICASIFE